MAEPTLRLPVNTPGPYFVDETCIDCDQCRSSVPSVFARHDDGGNSYVHRQPADAGEIAAVENARMDCPSESIGREDSVPGV